MDNLFNSRKLFTALYISKALAYGVICTNSCGLPPSVKQVEEKNPNKAELIHSTTKAGVLNNDPSCPNLVATSVYDTKPLNFMSTVTESVRWIKKKRMLSR